MEKINNLQAESELNQWLIDTVNEREEFEILKAEEARLSSSFSNRLKGGTRR